MEWNGIAVGCSTCDAHQPEARTDHEQTALARQIAHKDAEIDRLVYELYGLSEEEIALVEAATKKSDGRLRSFGRC